MAKLNNQQLKDFGLFGVKSARQPKVVTPEQDKLNKDKRHAENNLQTKICTWLTNTYPGIIFFSDFAAGLHLPKNLAVIRSKQSCEGKYPDITIMHPVGLFHGMVIELKTIDGDVFLKDGSLSQSQHTQGQNDMLKRLADLGYYTDFGVGEIDIKIKITEYMAGIAIQKYY